MQVVQGDAGPGQVLASTAKAPKAPGWVRHRVSVSQGPSPSLAPESLSRQHVEPDAVLSLLGHSLSFGSGPEASLDHTQPFCFIIIRIRGTLFLVP